MPSYPRNITSHRSSHSRRSGFLVDNRVQEGFDVTPITESQENGSSVKLVALTPGNEMQIPLSMEWGPLGRSWVNRWLRSVAVIEMVAT
ncbi:hypothetical protein B296_00030182 [Ensete ventricosum]|uniref:Uncharacterized protein n=1 Tax=Ensete ventricosum TaxID=4639 RepID=A0A426ZIC5_ENSVE|nr:hypothetical protein B296_00030182 [Ensete ventricosum]